MTSYIFCLRHKDHRIPSGAERHSGNTTFIAHESYSLYAYHLTAAKKTPSLSVVTIVGDPFP